MKLDIQLFGALPARRVSKTSKRLRRTHLKKDAPTMTKCSNCGEVLKPHRACTACGFYKGKDVLKKSVKEEAVKKETPVKEAKKTTPKKVVKKVSKKTGE